MASSKMLLVCSLGIFFSYFFYGILQEKITKTKYGVNEEKFTCILSLVSIQCIINAAVAYFAIKLTKSDSSKCKVPKLTFAFSAFSYIGAMFASNYALKHINYPTQVLGKSAKPIPVMFLGVFWAKKQYPLQKYLFVFMITIGVMLFLMKDINNFSLNTSSSWNFGIGELFLIISLTLDGFTGAIQDNLRSKYSIKAYDLMLNTNIYSMIYLFPAIFISGEHFQLIDFLSKYPQISMLILLFGMTSAIGQVFIFTTITNYGPLTTSIVTTTRKFFTILASVVIFGNSLTSTQYIATGLVFTGLLLDQLFSGKSKVKSG